MRKSPGGGREGQMGKTIPAVLVLVNKKKEKKKKEAREPKPIVKVKPSLEKP